MEIFSQVEVSDIKMTGLSQDDIKLASMLCELLSSMTYAPDLCSSLELSGNITPFLKIYK